MTTALALGRGHVCSVCWRNDTIYAVHLVWATKPVGVVRLGGDEIKLSDWAAVCSRECLDRLSPEYVVCSGVANIEGSHWQKLGDYYVEHGELLPQERPGPKS